MAFRVIEKGAKRDGGKPSFKTYHFHCSPCDAWFEGLSYHSDALQKVLPVRHRSCGQLAEQRWKTGHGPKFKSSEVVPRDFRSVYQKYWNLTDQEMSKVTREEMDRDMKNRGLSFVDASWDENANGSKRLAGKTGELPPDTEDPNEVRDYLAKKHGRDYVVDQEHEINAMFDEALRAEARGDRYELPQAEDVDVHDTPHRIDLEKTVESLAAAPVVQKDRRQTIQGRLITGQ